MRTGRLSLILVGLALAVIAQTTAVLAQRASDVRLDSAVRSLEMGAPGGARRPHRRSAQQHVGAPPRAPRARKTRRRVGTSPSGTGSSTSRSARSSSSLPRPAKPAPARASACASTFRTTAPRPGAYSFRLRVTSPDGSVEYDSADYTIVVPEPPASNDSGVSLSVTYPVLRGPFHEPVRVRGRSRQRHRRRLLVQPRGRRRGHRQAAPRGWEIAFSPSFGQERLISSISVNDSLTERVDVRVSPPRNTPPGDYFVLVRVSDEAGFEAGTLLQITIRGRGEVLASTDTGRLNVEATAGETASAKMRLTNFGTADLVDITLLADAPQGWEVAFDPSTSPPLPVNNQIDIPLTILPAADAIPGDYLITLRANHPDTSDSVELRVTVPWRSPPFGAGSASFSSFSSSADSARSSGGSAGDDRRSFPAHRGRRTLEGLRRFHGRGRR